MNILQTIQQKLKVPKAEYNEFGGYFYRSKESIIGALKPMLGEIKGDLIFNDTLILLGDRIFVRSQALLTAEGDENTYTAHGYAEHAKELKGMQSAQITGATSSYAQKSAMEALFLIDGSGNLEAMKPDVKITTKIPASRQPVASGKTAGSWLNAGTKPYSEALVALKDNKTTIDDLKKTYKISKATEAKLLTESK